MKKIKKNYLETVLASGHYEENKKNYLKTVLASGHYEEAETPAQTDTDRHRQLFPFVIYLS